MFHKREVTDIFFAESNHSLELTLYSSRIQAGFPSPTEDFEEGKLDLNNYLIKNPPATFFVRVSGDSMIGAGIHPGDLLVIDRSLDPSNGKIIITVINGELTVKRLKLEKREGQTHTALYSETLLNILYYLLQKKWVLVSGV